MKAKVVAVIVVLVLVATIVIPVSRLLASGEVMCQPDVYELKSYFTHIEVQDGLLPVRYYYPDARRQKGQAIIFGNYFAADTLPGVILLPSTNLDGTDPQHVLTENLGGEAAKIASKCSVVMVLLFRGQGPHSEVNTEYDWMSPDFEQDDLETLLGEIIAAPGTTGPGGEGDLVYDDAIGLLGFSQGASATWMATANTTSRTAFAAGVAKDGYILDEAWLLPQGCVSGHMAQFVAPGAYRTPWPDSPPYPDPTEAGISWNDTSFPQLYNAYVSSHPPLTATLASLVETRQAVGAQLGTKTPEPHTMAMVSPNDGFQSGNAAITAFQELTPTAQAGTFPYHSLFIGLGAASHADDVWTSDAATPRARRIEAQQSWILHDLTPAYGSPPTPLPTSTTNPDATRTPTPTPINTPAPFEYVVDSFSSNGAITPTFEVYTSTIWPPPGATPIILYLNVCGTAGPATPSAFTASDLISQ